MELEIVVELGIPIILGVMMLGMGLSLSLKDFKIIFVQPKAVITGLCLQLILLPVIGLALAFVLNVSSTIAMGIVILAACPGGPGSNVVSFLCNGDVALSVSLTAISSCITVITIPFIVNLGLFLFMSHDQFIAFSVVEASFKIFFMTLFPVIIGMLISKKWPPVARNSEKIIKVLSVVFFLILVAAVFIKERNELWRLIKETGLPDILLCLIAMSLSLLFSRLIKISKQQSKTIAIEVGIQNSALAIVIATSILKNTQYAFSAIVYSPVMLGISSILILYTLIKQKK